MIHTARMTPVAAVFVLEDVARLLLLNYEVKMYMTVCGIELA